MARIDWNQAELARLLDSATGPVGRDLEAKAGRVRDEAQRRCPVSPDGSNGNPPGHLRDSITDSLGRDEQGLYAQVGTDVSYAPMVELGTRPHVIESKGDYPLRNPVTGQVFGKRVEHPGTEAQPFLRPALEILRDE